MQEKAKICLVLLQGLITLALLLSNTASPLPEAIGKKGTVFFLRAILAAELIAQMKPHQSYVRSLAKICAYRRFVI